MAEGNMFKTAFGGYAKQEVENYIQELKMQREADVNSLNNKIEELEESILGQRATIDSKNKEMEELLAKMQRIGKENGGRLSQLSDMVDELTIKEMNLTKEKDKMEAQYKKEIADLKELLKNKEVEYQNEVERIKTESENALSTQKDEINSSYAAKINDLETAIKAEKRRSCEQADALRKSGIRQINSLNDAHKAELEKLEAKIRGALEDEYMKQSREAANDLEMETRFKIDKMLFEARNQCDEMRRRTEIQLSEKRDLALTQVNRELKEREKLIEAANKQINEIIDGIENNKNKFVVECNKVKDTLKRLK